MNGFMMFGTSFTRQLLTPNSFDLTVITGCNSTTLTASVTLPISLKVWDVAANYPSTGAWFTDFTDSVSTAKNDPFWCPK
jgi:hypothetical protein